MLRWRQLWEEESGSELVEFALASTLFFLVFLGIVGFSLAFYTDHFVVYAAREGARYAMVRGSTWSAPCDGSANTVNCEAQQGDIETYIQSIVPAGISASHLQVTANWTDATPSGAGCSSDGDSHYPGCVVRVTVSYPFQFLLPFLPAGTFTMSSTAAETIYQ